MTEAESTRLTKLLTDMVAQWAKDYPNPIIKNHSYLNEDSSQFYTSEAELQVFKISPKELHRLHAAHYTYLGFIEVADSSAYDKELYNLLIKARDICPPLNYYGQQIPFTTGNDDPQTFIWYCKTFFNLSQRSSTAFWQKQHFNTSHLITYDDEQHHTIIDVLPPLRQDKHQPPQRPIFSDWNKDPF
ncbi:hypothetical protein [Aquimarina longa]|uniref:hypothetical protein n=1 Tax=Aquimarina longa TaxID=1080221 RepID=UPI0007859021|nr:hypothetical protein [Aquimarina longa]